MGPYGSQISKRYSSHKSQPNVFKLFLNFLSNGPHKTTLWIFEIWKIEILPNFIRFVNMAPYVNENFKTLLLYKSPPTILKLGPNDKR